MLATFVALTLAAFECAARSLKVNALLTRVGIGCFLDHLFLITAAYVLVQAQMCLQRFWHTFLPRTAQRYTHCNCTLLLPAIS